MDCHICLDKKPFLRSLSCSHELCTKCFVRLNKPQCPYCRTGFVYTPDELKQRAKLGITNGYQSNNIQPGMSLPDEFVFPSHSLLLNNLHETPNVRSRTYSDSIIQTALRFEESEAYRSSNRNNRNIHKEKIFSKPIEEIEERRNQIAKRVAKKWLRKDGFALKHNGIW